MSTEQPPELKAILALLPCKWKLLRLVPCPMGWMADLKFKNMEFRLVSDRFYIGVSSLRHHKMKTKMKTIEPPPDQRRTISPEQICALLKKGVEDWDE